MHYLNEAPKPTADQIAKILRLDEEAAAAYQAKADSFDRCDTDGFLSQWASGITGDLKRTQREILKNGGYAVFPVLVDGDGNIVSTETRSFQNKYDYSWDRKWLVPDSIADGLGRKWIPTGKTSRIQKQLGLHEETRWFPAYAKIEGRGTGLAGAASCYVGVFKCQNEQVAA
jgi:hypothetical protein